MKRTIALIAILAFACLMVFAGGDEEKSSAPAKASGDRITLTVWGSQEDQAMLKEMCNAEVVITSTIGEGTTAKIIIPKKNNEEN